MSGSGNYSPCGCLHPLTQIHRIYCLLVQHRVGFPLAARPPLSSWEETVGGGGRVSPPPTPGVLGMPVAGIHTVAGICTLLPTGSLVHPGRRLGVCCPEDGEASAWGWVSRRWRAWFREGGRSGLRRWEESPALAALPFAEITSVVLLTEGQLLTPGKPALQEEVQARTGE